MGFSFFKWGVFWVVYVVILGWGWGLEDEWNFCVLVFFFVFILYNKCVDNIEFEYVFLDVEKMFESSGDKMGWF